MTDVARYRAGLRLAVVCVALVFAGCQTEGARQRERLSEIARTLPGEYDNRAQAQTETAGGEVAVALKVTAMVSVVLGNKAFYVRESVAADPRRLLGQRIWAFSQGEDGRILQAIYLFKEPQRWRAADEQPELLLSILEQDLIALSGCTLEWQAAGSGFDAAPDVPSTKEHAADKKGSGKSPAKPPRCEPGAKQEGAMIDRAASLRGDALTLTEQRTSADGGLRALADEGAQYQFVRRSGSGTSSSDAGDRSDAH